MRHDGAVAGTKTPGSGQRFFPTRLSQRAGLRTNQPSTHVAQKAKKRIKPWSARLTALLTATLIAWLIASLIASGQLGLWQRLMARLMDRLTESSYGAVDCAADEARRLPFSSRVPSSGTTSLGVATTSRSSSESVIPKNKHRVRKH